MVRNDKEMLQAHAQALGFVDVKCVTAAPIVTQDIFNHWLAAGCAAGMEFLSRQAPLRHHPETILPGARTVCMLAARYIPVTTNKHFAAYALMPDYHVIIRNRLHLLAEQAFNVSKNKLNYRACVDSAPLPERAWAIRAGLGGRGRQGALLHSTQGCCLFLGSLILDQELPCEHHDSTLALADGKHSLTQQPDYAPACAECRLCLDACPNSAIGADGLVDARRCAAYWTVEHKDIIPLTAVKFVGQRLFGCDYCTSVCPVNPTDTQAVMPEFRSSAITPPTPVECLHLTEQQFLKTFQGTPVMRLGRARLQRNAVILLWNMGKTVHAGSYPELTPLAIKQIQLV